MAEAATLRVNHRPSTLSTLWSLQSLLFLIVLTVLYGLPSVECQFTQVTDAAAFPARYQSLSFESGGAIWVTGGLETVNGSPDGLLHAVNETWSSYDFGRSWAQPVDTRSGSVVSLPGTCASEGVHGVSYNGAVYLVCGSTRSSHGNGGSGSNDGWTFTNTDPSLTTAWTTLKDGCAGCSAFCVERMAVPFDGIGTLVIILATTITYCGSRRRATSSRSHRVRDRREESVDGVHSIGRCGLYPPLAQPTLRYDHHRR